MKSSTSHKFLSTVLSFLLLANSSFAFQPETNIWAERKNQRQSKQAQPLQLAALPRPVANLSFQRPTSFTKPVFKSQKTKSHTSKELPLQYGSIRTIINAKNSSPAKTLIHIHDIHQNHEAQKNISHTIKSILTQHRVGVIAVEGAFDKINVAPFREFGDLRSLNIVAASLLAQQKIAGPFHAALTAETSLPPVIGVDGKTDYFGNVNALKTAHQQRSQMQAVLDQQKISLQNEKRRLFNSDLYSFDQTVDAYRKGDLQFSPYVHQLNKFIPFKKTSALALFSKAARLEKELDFKMVEKDRAALLAKLSSRLSQNDLNLLVQMATEYRAGRTSHVDFYAFIQLLCRKANLPLKKFPTMARYIQYVLLADRIQSDQLFAEIKKAEEKIYGRFIKTDTEKSLIHQSREHYILGKLVEFALSKDEWDEAKEISNPQFSIFKKFYGHAENRDEAIASNLLKSLNNQKEDTAILVTGGFHSAGIHERLKEANLTIVSFIPKITQVKTHHGTAYLNTFLREKSPLENLFKPDRLFLSPLVAAPATMVETGTALTGQKVLDGSLTPQEAPSFFSRLMTALTSSYNATLSLYEVLQKKIRGAVSMNDQHAAEFEMEQQGNGLFNIEWTKEAVMMTVGTIWAGVVMSVLMLSDWSVELKFMFLVYNLLIAGMGAALYFYNQPPTAWGQLAFEGASAGNTRGRGFDWVKELSQMFMSGRSSSDENDPPGPSVGMTYDPGPNRIQIERNTLPQLLRQLHQWALNPDDLPTAQLDLPSEFLATSTHRSLMTQFFGLLQQRSTIDMLRFMDTPEERFRYLVQLLHERWYEPQDMLLVTDTGDLPFDETSYDTRYTVGEQRATMGSVGLGYDNINLYDVGLPDDFQLPPSRILIGQNFSNDRGFIYFNTERAQRMSSDFRSAMSQLSDSGNAVEIGFADLMDYRTLSDLLIIGRQLYPGFFTYPADIIPFMAGAMAQPQGLYLLSVAMTVFPAHYDPSVAQTVATLYQHATGNDPGPLTIQDQFRELIQGDIMNLTPIFSDFAQTTYSSLMTPVVGFSDWVSFIQRIAPSINLGVVQSYFSSDESETTSTTPIVTPTGVSLFDTVYSNYTPASEAPGMGETTEEHVRFIQGEFDPISNVGRNAVLDALRDLTFASQAEVQDLAITDEVAFQVSESGNLTIHIPHRIWLASDAAQQDELTREIRLALSTLEHKWINGVLMEPLLQAIEDIIRDGRTDAFAPLRSQLSARFHPLLDWIEVELPRAIESWRAVESDKDIFSQLAGRFLNDHIFDRRNLTITTAYLEGHPPSLVVLNIVGRGGFYTAGPTRLEHIYVDPPEGIGLNLYMGVGKETSDIARYYRVPSNEPGRWDRLTNTNEGVFAGLYQAARQLKPNPDHQLDELLQYFLADMSLSYLAQGWFDPNEPIPENFTQRVRDEMTSISDFPPAFHSLFDDHRADDQLAYLLTWATHPDPNFNMLAMLVLQILPVGNNDQPYVGDSSEIVGTYFESLMTTFSMQQLLMFGRHFGIDVDQVTDYDSLVQFITELSQVEPARIQELRQSFQAAFRQVSGGQSDQLPALFATVTRQDAAAPHSGATIFSFSEPAPEPPTPTVTPTNHESLDTLYNEFQPQTPAPPIERIDPNSIEFIVGSLTIPSNPALDVIGRVLRQYAHVKPPAVQASEGNEIEATIQSDGQLSLKIPHDLWDKSDESSLRELERQLHLALYKYESTLLHPHLIGHLPALSLKYLQGSDFDISTLYQNLPLEFHPLLKWIEDEFPRALDTWKGHGTEYTSRFITRLINQHILRPRNLGVFVAESGGLITLPIARSAGTYVVGSGQTEYVYVGTEGSIYFEPRGLGIAAVEANTGRPSEFRQWEDFKDVSQGPFVELYGAAQDIFQDTSNKGDFHYHTYVANVVNTYVNAWIPVTTDDLLTEDPPIPDETRRFFTESDDFPPELRPLLDSPQWKAHLKELALWVIHPDSDFDFLSWNIMGSIPATDGWKPYTRDHGSRNQAAREQFNQNLQRVPEATLLYHIGSFLGLTKTYELTHDSLVEFLRDLKEVDPSRISALKTKIQATIFAFSRGQSDEVRAFIAAGTSEQADAPFEGATYHLLPTAPSKEEENELLEPITEMTPTDHISMESIYQEYQPQREAHRLRPNPMQKYDFQGSPSAPMVDIVLSVLDPMVLPGQVEVHATDHVSEPSYQWEDGTLHVLIPSTIYTSYDQVALADFRTTLQSNLRFVEAEWMSRDFLPRLIERFALALRDGTDVHLQDLIQHIPNHLILPLTWLEEEGTRALQLWKPRTGLQSINLVLRFLNEHIFEPQNLMIVTTDEDKDMELRPIVRHAGEIHAGASYARVAYVEDQSDGKPITFIRGGGSVPIPIRGAKEEVVWDEFRSVSGGPFGDLYKAVQDIVGNTPPQTPLAHRNMLAKLGEKFAEGWFNTQRQSEPFYDINVEAILSGQSAFPSSFLNVLRHTEHQEYYISELILLAFHPKPNTNHLAELVMNILPNTNGRPIQSASDTTDADAQQNYFSALGSDNTRIIFLETLARALGFELQPVTNYDSLVDLLQKLSTIKPGQLAQLRTNLQTVFRDVSNGQADELQGFLQEARTEQGPAPHSDADLFLLPNAPEAEAIAEAPAEAAPVVLQTLHVTLDTVYDRFEPSTPAPDFGDSGVSYEELPSSEHGAPSSAVGRIIQSVMAEFVLVGPVQVQVSDLATKVNVLPNTASALLPTTIVLPVRLWKATTNTEQGDLETQVRQGLSEIELEWMNFYLINGIAPAANQYITGQRDFDLSALKGALPAAHVRPVLDWIEKEGKAALDIFKEKVGLQAQNLFARFLNQHIFNRRNIVMHTMEIGNQGRVELSRIARRAGTFTSGASERELLYVAGNQENITIPLTVGEQARTVSVKEVPALISWDDFKQATGGPFAEMYDLFRELARDYNPVKGREFDANLSLITGALGEGWFLRGTGEGSPITIAAVPTLSQIDTFPQNLLPLFANADTTNQALARILSAALHPQADHNFFAALLSHFLPMNNGQPITKKVGDTDDATARNIYFQRIQDGISYEIFLKLGESLGLDPSSVTDYPSFLQFIRDLIKLGPENHDALKRNLQAAFREASGGQSDRLRSFFAHATIEPGPEPDTSSRLIILPTTQEEEAASTTAASGPGAGPDAGNGGNEDDAEPEYYDFHQIFHETTDGLTGRPDVPDFDPDTDVTIEGGGISGAIANALRKALAKEGVTGKINVTKVKTNNPRAKIKVEGSIATQTIELPNTKVSTTNPKEVETLVNQAVRRLVMARHRHENDNQDLIAQYIQDIANLRRPAINVHNLTFYSEEETERWKWALDQLKDLIPKWKTRVRQNLDQNRQDVIDLATHFMNTFWFYDHNLVLHASRLRVNNPTATTDRIKYGFEVVRIAVHAGFVKKGKWDVPVLYLSNSETMTPSEQTQAYIGLSFDYLGSYLSHLHTLQNRSVQTFDIHYRPWLDYHKAHLKSASPFQLGFLFFLRELGATLGDLWTRNWNAENRARVMKAEPHFGDVEASTKAALSFTSFTLFGDLLGDAATFIHQMIYPTSSSNNLPLHPNDFNNANLELFGVLRGFLNLMLRQMGAFPDEGTHLRSDRELIEKLIELRFGLDTTLAKSIAETLADPLDQLSQGESQHVRSLVADDNNQPYFVTAQHEGNDIQVPVLSNAPGLTPTDENESDDDNGSKGGKGSGPDDPSDRPPGSPGEREPNRAPDYVQNLYLDNNGERVNIREIDTIYEDLAPEEGRPELEPLSEDDITFGPHISGRMQDFIRRYLMTLDLADQYHIEAVNQRNYSLQYEIDENNDGPARVVIQIPNKLSGQTDDESIRTILRAIHSRVPRLQSNKHTRISDLINTFLVNRIQNGDESLSLSAEQQTALFNRLPKRDRPYWTWMGQELEKAVQVWSQNYGPKEALLRAALWLDQHWYVKRGHTLHPSSLGNDKYWIQTLRITGTMGYLPHGDGTFKPVYYLSNITDVPPKSIFATVSNFFSSALSVTHMDRAIRFMQNLHNGEWHDDGGLDMTRWMNLIRPLIQNKNLSDRFEDLAFEMVSATIFHMWGLGQLADQPNDAFSFLATKFENPEQADLAVGHLIPTALFGIRTHSLLLSILLLIGPRSIRDSYYPEKSERTAKWHTLMPATRAFIWHYWNLEGSALPISDDDLETTVKRENIIDAVETAQGTNFLGSPEFQTLLEQTATALDAYSNGQYQDLSAFANNVTRREAQVGINQIEIPFFQNSPDLQEVNEDELFGFSDSSPPAPPGSTGGEDLDDDSDGTGDQTGTGLPGGPSDTEDHGGSGDDGPGDGTPGDDAEEGPADIPNLHEWLVELYDVTGGDTWDWPRMLVEDLELVGTIEEGEAIVERFWDEDQFQDIRDTPPSHALLTRILNEDGFDPAVLVPRRAISQDTANHWVRRFILDLQNRSGRNISSWEALFREDALPLNLLNATFIFFISSDLLEVERREQPGDADMRELIQTEIEAGHVFNADENENDIEHSIATRRNVPLQTVHQWLISFILEHEDRQGRTRFIENTLGITEDQLLAWYAQYDGLEDIAISLRLQAPDADAFIQVVRDNNGILGHVADWYEVDRRVVYRWYREYPSSVREALRDIRPDENTLRNWLVMFRGNINAISHVFDIPIATLLGEDGHEGWFSDLDQQLALALQLIDRQGWDFRMLLDYLQNGVIIGEGDEDQLTLNERERADLMNWLQTQFPYLFTEIDRLPVLHEQIQGLINPDPEMDIVEIDGAYEFRGNRSNVNGHGNPAQASVISTEHGVISFRVHIYIDPESDFRHHQFTHLFVRGAYQGELRLQEDPEAGPGHFYAEGTVLLSNRYREGINNLRFFAVDARTDLGTLIRGPEYQVQVRYDGPGATLPQARAQMAIIRDRMLNEQHNRENRLHRLRQTLEQIFLGDFEQDPDNGFTRLNETIELFRGNVRTILVGMEGQADLVAHVEEQYLGESLPALNWNEEDPQLQGNELATLAHRVDELRVLMAIRDNFTNVNTYEPVALREGHERSFSERAATHTLEQRFTQRQSTIYHSPYDERTVLSLAARVVNGGLNRDVLVVIDRNLLRDWTRVLQQFEDPIPYLDLATGSFEDRNERLNEVLSEEQPHGRVIFVTSEYLRALHPAYGHRANEENVQLPSDASRGIPASTYNRSWTRLQQNLGLMVIAGAHQLGSESSRLPVVLEDLNPQPERVMRIGLTTVPSFSPTNDGPESFFRFARFLDSARLPDSNQPFQLRGDRAHHRENRIAFHNLVRDLVVQFEPEHIYPHPEDQSVVPGERLRRVQRVRVYHRLNLEQMIQYFIQVINFFVRSTVGNVKVWDNAMIRLFASEEKYRALQGYLDAEVEKHPENGKFVLHAAHNNQIQEIVRRLENQRPGEVIRYSGNDETNTYREDRRVVQFLIDPETQQILIDEESGEPRRANPATSENERRSATVLEINELRFRYSRTVRFLVTTPNLWSDRGERDFPEITHHVFFNPERNTHDQEETTFNLRPRADGTPLTIAHILAEYDQSFLTQEGFHLTPLFLETFFGEWAYDEDKVERIRLMIESMDQILRLRGQGDDAMPDGDEATIVNLIEWMQTILARFDEPIDTASQAAHQQQEERERDLAEEEQWIREAIVGALRTEVGFFGGMYPFIDQGREDAFADLVRVYLSFFKRADEELIPRHPTIQATEVDQYGQYATFEFTQTRDENQRYQVQRNPDPVGAVNDTTPPRLHVNDQTLNDLIGDTLDGVLPDGDARQVFLDIQQSLIDARELPNAPALFRNWSHFFFQLSSFQVSDTDNSALIRTSFLREAHQRYISQGLLIPSGPIQIPIGPEELNFTFSFNYTVRDGAGEEEWFRRLLLDLYNEVHQAAPADEFTDEIGQWVADNIHLFWSRGDVYGFRDHVKYLKKRLQSRLDRAPFNPTMPREPAEATPSTESALMSALWSPLLFWLALVTRPVWLVRVVYGSLIALEETLFSYLIPHLVIGFFAFDPTIGNAVMAVVILVMIVPFGFGHRKKVVYDGQTLKMKDELTTGKRWSLAARGLVYRLPLIVFLLIPGSSIWLGVTLAIGLHLFDDFTTPLQAAFWSKLLDGRNVNLRVREIGINLRAMNDAQWDRYVNQLKTKKLGQGWQQKLRSFLASGETTQKEWILPVSTENWDALVALVTNGPDQRNYHLIIDPTREKEFRQRLQNTPALKGRVSFIVNATSFESADSVHFVNQLDLEKAVWHVLSAGLSRDQVAIGFFDNVRLQNTSIDSTSILHHVTIISLLDSLLPTPMKLRDWTRLRHLMDVVQSQA